MNEKEHHCLLDRKVHDRLAGQIYSEFLDSVIKYEYFDAMSLYRFGYEAWLNNDPKTQNGVKYLIK